MDRAAELKDLGTAKKHIAEAMRHVEMQQAIIRDRERDGLDTTIARRVLELFKWTLESREFVTAELQRIASQSARRP